MFDSLFLVWFCRVRKQPECLAFAPPLVAKTLGGVRVLGTVSDRLRLSELAVVRCKRSQINQLAGSESGSEKWDREKLANGITERKHWFWYRDEPSGRVTTLLHSLSSNNKPPIEIVLAPELHPPKQPVVGRALIPVRVVPSHPPPPSTGDFSSGF